jgi:Heavy metal binding domain
MVVIVPMRLVAILFATLLCAQEPPAAKFPLPTPDAPEPAVEFVCPMDPDVRSKTPGKCPRCGMALVAGIPDYVEYPVELKATPRVLKPGEKVELAFSVRDPKSGAIVKNFVIMHEKLYHMFIVSQDLKFFIHEHPAQSSDGVFRYEAVLPKPGMYRVLSDFYPKGGTPQLIARTLIVPGIPITPGGRLEPDLKAQKAENLTAALRMEPAEPIAGMKTLMFFKLDPAEGLEQYLGAWGHMMAASQDLVDMIHTHPFLANGGPDPQFNLIFPRPGVYRVWVQFQRKGVVNTVAFNVPVSELK